MTNLMAYAIGCLQIRGDIEEAYEVQKRTNSARCSCPSHRPSPIFVRPNQLPDRIEFNYPVVDMKPVGYKNRHLGAVGQCPNCSRIFYWEHRESPAVQHFAPITSEDWNSACAGLGTKLR